MRDEPISHREDDDAIKCVDLGIKYRRYTRKSTTMKQAVLSLFKGTQFESFWALRNINLTVKKGQSLGVIGPNGSGKSTMLKAFARVMPPAEGTMEAHGRLAPLIELGGGFNPELTGRENIFLNGAIMGIPQRVMHEKIDSIIEFADIGDFIDAPLSTYSSGMRGRLGFAVATDIDPEILLLDEIFAVGDEAFKNKARARIEAFFESQRTVVLVTHSLLLVRTLCDRAIALQKGEIVAEGAPDDVVDDYLDRVKTRSKTAPEPESKRAVAT